MAIKYKADIKLWPRYLTAVVISSLLCIFTGCSLEKEVPGEVFIVTQGGSSIKLGLVDVRIIPESEFTPYIQKKIAAAKLEITNINPKLNILKEESSQLLRSLNEAGTKLLSLFDKLIKDPDQKMRILTESIEKDKKDKKHPTSDIMLAVKSYSRSPSEKIESEKIEKILKDLEGRLEENDKEYKAAQLKYIRFQGGPYYVEGLPQGQSYKTDADGRFLMKLPKGKYAVVAHATRKTIDATEEYYWFVWQAVDGNPKKLMLSNDNLLETNCQDCIINLKQLPY